MHDHVQQSFSPSLTHRYYIQHAGNSPVLSVNIESMDDVTSGVAHALVLLKANSLCLLFSYFLKSPFYTIWVSKCALSLSDMLTYLTSDCQICIDIDELQPSRVYKYSLGINS